MSAGDWLCAAIGVWLIAWTTYRWRRPWNHS